MRKVRLVLMAAVVLFAPALASAQTLVREVRAAIARNDFAGGDALVVSYRAKSGTTPEALAALSWLGRGTLVAKDYDKAERYARDTERITLEVLKTRTMASD